MKKSTHSIWFDKPGGHLPPVTRENLPVSELMEGDAPSSWETQALPVGNGYMGAMIYGGVEAERIQFNEKTLWTGGPGASPDYRGGNRPGAAEALPKVRALLRQGKKKEAGALCNACLTGLEEGFGAYQNFGEIHIAFPVQSSEVPKDYRRC